MALVDTCPEWGVSKCCAPSDWRKAKVVTGQHRAHEENLVTILGNTEANMLYTDCKYFIYQRLTPKPNSYVNIMFFFP